MRNRHSRNNSLKKMMAEAMALGDNANSSSSAAIAKGQSVVSVPCGSNSGGLSGTILKCHFTIVPTHMSSSLVLSEGY